MERVFLFVGGFVCILGGIAIALALAATAWAWAIDKMVSLARVKVWLLRYAWNYKAFNHWYRQNSASVRKID